MEIIKIAVRELEVHPRAAAVTCQTKKGNAHRFTMENFGQVEPITIVRRDGKPMIIDGIERFHVAKQLSSKLETKSVILIALYKKDRYVRK